MTLCYSTRCKLSVNRRITFTSRKSVFVKITRYTLVCENGSFITISVLRYKTAALSFVAKSLGMFDNTLGNASTGTYYRLIASSYRTCCETTNQAYRSKPRDRRRAVGNYNTVPAHNSFNRSRRWSWSRSGRFQVTGDILVSLSAKRVIFCNDNDTRVVRIT